MVTNLASSILAFGPPVNRLLWAAADEAAKSQTLLTRLDPQSRAKVLMALLGLALLGVGLVALVVVAGRHVQRIARTPYKPTRRYDDDWYRKPLIPKEPDSPARDPE